jgi:hypothetical protein
MSVTHPDLSEIREWLEAVVQTLQSSLATAPLSF